MALQSTPLDNYPFSTRDGKVIPLDILRSKSMLFQDFTAAADANITIPVGSKVVYGFATEDCVLVPGASPIVLSANTPIEKAVVLPRLHPVVFTVDEGAYKVRGITASGRVIIQVMEQWAGIGLDITYGRRG